MFEGIDIAAVAPKMKVSIIRRCEQNRRRSQSDAAPPMSMHAISLLLEAVFLKAKSLQGLGRYEGVSLHSCELCQSILGMIINRIKKKISYFYGIFIIDASIISLKAF